MRARWVVGVGGAALLACGALVGNSEDSEPPARVEAGADVAAPLADTGGADACTPRTCAALGATCGSAADECGDTIPDCGTCSGNDFCGGGGPNKCGSKPCEAGTCTGGQCGAISDGCNATLQCGCAANETCQGRTCAPACTAMGACNSVAGVDCSGGGQNLYSCSSSTTIGQLPSTDCALCRKGNTSATGVFYCCP